ncbi:hypothetical protein SAMN04487949_1889 [Halogranum gelatinilyticum]|uniref:Domain of unknown function domain-containing protein n=1 Tax=Halogranum gelatinilyticum TaxID=660521 RepID=A0A1G9TS38_9EURY|nr:hypothetical protein [Halogranum gelatinilyticum]SDM50543.1 hypothetical protein SAMN04487949_1889 [Halogranum gelatinilyticum]
MDETKQMMPSDDRDRGILTPDDRKFLKGKKEFSSEQSERDARYRIRKRVKNSILDFSILLHHLDERDRKQVFSKHMAKSSDDEISSEKLREFVESTMFSQGISDAISLLYLGVSDAGDSFEAVLKEGVAGAEESKGYLVDSVSVDIDVSRGKPDMEDLVSKLNSGEPLSEEEIRAVINSGQFDIDAESLDMLLQQISSQLSVESEDVEINLNYEPDDE